MSGTRLEGTGGSLEALRSLHPIQMRFLHEDFHHVQENIFLGLQSQECVDHVCLE